MDRATQLLGRQVVIGMITHWAERVLGRGDYSVAIPVMDGPLQPNQALDEDTSIRAEMPMLDNVVWTGRELLFASGNSLWRLPDLHRAAPEEVRNFDHPIASLALLHDGGLAVGLDGRGICIHGGDFDGLTFESSEKLPLNCPTAILSVSASEIVVCNGSTDLPASRWKHDLMSLGHSGRVHAISLETKAVRQLAKGLAFPYGLARFQGDIVVS